LLIDAFIASHKEQASTTALEVGAVDVRRYREPLDERRTKMVVRDPNGAEHMNLQIGNLALLSITSTKS
jgi:hypothetical protein